MTDPLQMIAAEVAQAERSQGFRRAAWLPFDVLCGRVVDHFSLTHWVYLLEARNAFFEGRMPLGGDVAQVLWTLRPQSDWMSKPDRKFMREVGKLKTEEAMREIADYFARALYDIGNGNAAEGQSGIELAAFPAHFVDRFGARYGWSIDAVMTAPLARLGQLDRVARAADDDKAVYTSRLIALQAKQMAMEAVD